MAAEGSGGEVFQFRVHLLGISPMIWRGLQLRGDQTLADLHDAIQVAFDWTDYNLHQFVRRGRTYCVPREFGIDGDDATAVKLVDLSLKPGERFKYDYDFIAWWRHQVRFERRVPANSKTSYPYCSGGARTAPQEGHGGPEHFMELRDAHSPIALIEQGMGLLEAILDSDEALLRYRDEHIHELPEMRYWLGINKVDRKLINRKLKQHAKDALRQDKSEVIDESPNPDDR